MTAGPLVIAVDVAHPHVYLGFDAICSLLDETRVAAEWRPLASYGLKVPVEPGAGASRGERHRYQRARYHAMDVERYARRRGLELHGLYRSPDRSTFAATLLWLGAEQPGHVRAWLDQVLRGYWAERLDIENPDALLAVARSVGAQTDGAQDWVGSHGAEAAAQADAELREQGVFTVPGFLLDGEPFLGRQHVPMLRWILTGRQGPGPI